MEKKRNKIMIKKIIMVNNDDSQPFIIVKTCSRYRLGVVARSCNPATWRSGSEDALRVGVLLSGVLCRSGVRTKLGINMGLSGEPRRSRLSKEERIGPGWKHSRQKFPCRAVVGSRP